MQYVPLEQKPKVIGPKPKMDICCILALVWGILAILGAGAFFIPNLVAIVMSAIGTYRSIAGGLRGKNMAIAGYALAMLATLAGGIVMLQTGYDEEAVLWIILFVAAIPAWVIVYLTAKLKRRS